MEWPLAEAKQKFSEVLRRAQTEGPQYIFRRGTETAVVLSVDEYQRLSNEHDEDLKEFLLSGPTLDGLDLHRDSAPVQIPKL